MTRALWLALLIAGCGDSGRTMDAGASSDLGIGDLGTVGDGPTTLRVAFTVSGCATLDTSTGVPRCLGRSPLTLTFAPLGSGVTTFVWTFAGGTPASSHETSPTVTFATPGTYDVALAAGGPSGTATASGTVAVSSGTTGSACLADTDCNASAGLFCVCKPGEGGCTGALAVGFCSRNCAGGSCGAGEICADFTRGGAFVPVGADGGVAGSPETEVWRQALCVPGCTQTSDCVAGPICRDLPALPPGGQAGGVYTWKRGCFVEVGGDDGDSCLSASGQPDPSRCLSGRCDPYGLRGLCTSDCGSTSDCPSTAACATFTAPPAAPPNACLQRCGTAQSCEARPGADPLLAKEAADPSGGLGFTVTPGESSSATYWAPRRCGLSPNDCPAPWVCTTVGTGTAKFCLRN